METLLGGEQPSLLSQDGASGKIARLVSGLAAVDGASNPFAAAVRATRMPIVITNPRETDNPVVFVNDAFCRLTGSSRNEILGRNCRFLQGPDSDPAAIGRIRAAVAAAEPIEIDIRNYRKDGRPFWNRLLISPVYDAEGTLAYFVANQFDITLERSYRSGLERRNAALLAELVKDRQAFLLRLLDRLRTLSDPHAILETAVQALGRYLGVDRVGYGHVQADDETIMLEHGYADGAAFLAEPFSMLSFGLHNIFHLRQGLTVVSNDVAADPANFPEIGPAIEARSFVAVPLIREGKLTATFYVSQRGIRSWRPEDVSLVEDVAARTWDTIERARAEAALLQAKATLEQQVAERTATLRGNEARLRTIFETSLQFQGMLALDGTLLDANQTSLDAIESKLGDVVGKPFWNTPWFMGTAGMPELARAAVSQALQGRAIRQDIVVNLPTGRRSFDFALRAIRDQHGAIIAIIAEAVETTGRLQAEEALRQAHKMEAVGQLTGGIAHDFNNMLQGIGSGLELAQRRVGQGRDTEAVVLMETARKGVDRAAALTHRLLAFARRQALDAKPIVVDGLVLGLVELIQRTMGPSIEVRTRMGWGLWPIFCDANQLESALLNLAINARDAMLEGGVLTLSARDVSLSSADVAGEEWATAGDHVEIAVADTGEGMTPDVLKRVLEPFFTTKPLGEGTGLGLSQVYGFVRQSGGLLRLESAPGGGGTTVRVLMPRYHGAMAVPPAAAPALSLEVDASSFERTVLLVEDEPAVRATTAEALRDQGYTVLEAEHGSAGLHVLASGASVNLLVTDVGLPGKLNGRQLANTVRDRYPGLPVLFITGYAGTVLDGPLAPGMQVISKPFTLDALMARIRLMLKESAAD